MLSKWTPMIILPKVSLFTKMSNCLFVGSIQHIIRSVISPLEGKK